MRRTYAYNSVIFGFLLGALAGVSADSVALGIVVGLAVSVVGFIIIRLVENAIDKGVDKAADSISKAYRSHKAKKAAESGVPQAPARRTTQFPTREQSRRIIEDIRPRAAYETPAHAAAAARRCPCCGRTVEGKAGFCGYCGSVM